MIKLWEVVPREGIVAVRSNPSPPPSLFSPPPPPHLYPTSPMRRIQTLVEQDVNMNHSILVRVVVCSFG